VLNRGKRPENANNYEVIVHKKQNNQLARNIKRAQPFAIREFPRTGLNRGKQGLIPGTAW